MSERGFKAPKSNENSEIEPWVPAKALLIEKDALLQAISEMEKPKLVDISIRCGVSLADLLETLYQMERSHSLNVTEILGKMDDRNQKATKSFTVYKRIRDALEKLRTEKLRKGSDKYTTADLAQKLGMKPTTLDSHIKGIGAADFFELSGKGF